LKYHVLCFGEIRITRGKVENRIFWDGY